LVKMYVGTLRTRDARHTIAANHGAAPGAQVPKNWAGLHQVDLAMRIPARFALRVHHEGLPLLRLWQTKSALLSLGLNPKGKPGLWLTQKVP
jgi:hypothetical protein